MPTCEPWPGIYQNPHIYQSSTCGEVEVVTARKAGWSCDWWAAQHDAAVMDMQTECPPA